MAYIRNLALLAVFFFAYSFAAPNDKEFGVPPVYELETNDGISEEPADEQKQTMFKQLYQTDLDKRNFDMFGKRAKYPNSDDFKFLGKRGGQYRFLGKRAKFAKFRYKMLGKKSDDEASKRGKYLFLGK